MGPESRNFTPFPRIPKVHHLTLRRAVLITGFLATLAVGYVGYRTGALELWWKHILGVSPLVTPLEGDLVLFSPHVLQIPGSEAGLEGLLVYSVQEKSLAPLLPDALADAQAASISPYRDRVAVLAQTAAVQQLMVRPLGDGAGIVVDAGATTFFSQPRWAADNKTILYERTTYAAKDGVVNAASKKTELVVRTIGVNGESVYPEGMPLAVASDGKAILALVDGSLVLMRSDDTRAVLLKQLPLSAVLAVASSWNQQYLALLGGDHTLLLEMDWTAGTVRASRLADTAYSTAAFDRNGHILLMREQGSMVDEYSFVTDAGIDLLSSHPLPFAAGVVLLDWLRTEKL